LWRGAEPHPGYTAGLRYGYWLTDKPRTVAHARFFRSPLAFHHHGDCD